MKFNVTWDITQNCNENCRFCYRNKVKEDLSLEENIKILQNLYDSNIINKITFCGGEPLIYKYLFNLITSIQKPADIKLSIVTNGICLAKYLENKNRFEINEELMAKLIKNFQWICFSIDAANTDAEIKVSRNRTHFNRIIYILDYLEKNYEDINIKVNSIVTKYNYNDIHNLYDLLAKYKHIKRWKLFRYLGANNPEEINKEFEVTNGEFNEVLKFTSSIKNKNLKISVNNIEDYSGSYIMVKQDGTVEISNNGIIEEVLDLKKNSVNKILEIEAFNQEKHIKNRI